MKVVAFLILAFSLNAFADERVPVSGEIRLWDCVVSTSTTDCQTQILPAEKTTVLLKKTDVVNVLSGEHLFVRSRNGVNYDVSLKITKSSAGYTYTATMSITRDNMISTKGLGSAVFARVSHLRKVQFSGEMTESTGGPMFSEFVITP